MPPEDNQLADDEYSRITKEEWEQYEQEVAGAPAKAGPTEMQRLAQSLVDKQKLAADLTDQLRMWADVQAQGIDPETVESFSTRIWKDVAGKIPLTTKAQDEFFNQLYGKYRRFGPSWKERVHRDKCHYTHITLKDGTVRPLEPPVKAAPVTPPEKEDAAKEADQGPSGV